MSDHTFPIMAVRDGRHVSKLDFTVPWELIDTPARRAQAMMNHGQSLERLAERGGLDAREALAVVECRSFGDCLEDEEAEALLRGMAVQS